LENFTDSEQSKQLTLKNKKPKMTDAQIHATMVNGYNFLIKNETWSEAMQRNKCERVFYPFPIDEITPTDIQTLMEYFADPNIEQYEKCIKLNKLLKEWKHTTSQYLQT